MNLKNRILSPKLATALALLGMVSGSAQAALVAYDQFSGYTAGDLTGQGQGFGWGSNTWVAGGTTAIYSSTGNLTYSGLSTAGGGVTTGTNATADNMFYRRNVDTPLTATGTYYFGFLLDRTGNPSKAGFRIQNSDSTLYAGGGSWDSTSTWELYTRQGGAFAKASTGINETTDVTHFVVKMDFTTPGSHKASLYVNPADAL